MPSRILLAGMYVPFARAMLVLPYTEQLSEADIFDAPLVDFDAPLVELGSSVVVKIGEKKETFTVVGEWEADPSEKKISHESPLGKALLGKAVGDEIEVEAPAGKMLYKIVSIS